MRVVIHLPSQSLELFDEDGRLAATWPVSSAAAGAGEEAGSYRTPRGRHIIRAKIGAGLAPGSVLVARRPTGEIYTPELGAREPERDWILSRILWLSGREPGFNRLGTRDTMRRYIYIHGTPDEGFEARPCSHGCIRMRNADVIELFERVPVYTAVDILEK